MLITLVAALDRIEPGLGLRLLAAQVPGGRQMIEHLVIAPGYQAQPGRLQ